MNQNIKIPFVDLYPQYEECTFMNDLQEMAANGSGDSSAHDDSFVNAPVSLALQSDEVPSLKWKHSEKNCPERKRASKGSSPTPYPQGKFE